MKLNTLLLTSAATLMATSVAFAADLPSKKAAPAAGSVQVCKVGGMTGFTLPGSDTCVAISGRVTYDMAYDLEAGTDDGSSDLTHGAGYRLAVDARSNTELGVVRSFIQFEGGSVKSPSWADDDDVDDMTLKTTDVATTRRAYIQFAGLTAGKKDSLADIYGTQSNQLGLWTQSNLGIDYRVAAGGLSFAIGLEGPNNNNIDDDYCSGTALTCMQSGDRPDVVAQIAGSAGPLGFTVAAASHVAYDVDDEESYNGYAVMGNINAKFDSVGVFAFGGQAKGAGQYIAANSAKNQYNNDYVDYDGGDALESSVYGAGINFTMGKTFVNFEAAFYEHDDVEETDVTEVEQYNIYLSHTLAKGLTVQPEYMFERSREDGGAWSESSSLYLRIQRDF